MRGAWFSLRGGGREQGDQAKALYDKFRGVYPDNPLLPLLVKRDTSAAAKPVVGSPRDGLAEAFFNLASILYQEEARDMALIYDRLALDLRSDFPAAQVLLGDLMAADRHYTDAAAVYRSVDRTSPFGWQARLALVVTTPDNQAVMHCYATLKLAADIDSDAEVRVVVNRCDRPHRGVDVHQRLSSACQRFLGCVVTAAPSLPCHTNKAGESSPPRVWKSADSPFGHAVLWLGRAAIDVLAAPPATAGLRLAA